jgi:hypothetical protein
MGQGIVFSFTAAKLILLYRDYFPVFIVTTVRADIMRLFGFLTLGAKRESGRIKLVVSSSFSAS